MKNYEKYADVIKTYNNGSLCCGDIIIPNVLKPLGKSCVDTSCEMCNWLTTLWLLEDYEEPETDWSDVEVDTPILVKDYEDEEWKQMHFAERIIDTIYVWEDGKTSWTAKNTCPCNYAKLIETKKRCKEPEVDWSEVEVDTPILVRNDGVEWVKRHFAKYENGLVYAWKDSRTSWTTEDMTKWDYAKLAESEEE